MAKEGKSDMKIAVDQLAEYNRLKIEAGSRTAALRQDIEKLKREAAVEKVRPPE